MTQKDAIDIVVRLNTAMLALDEAIKIAAKAEDAVLQYEMLCISHRAAFAAYTAAKPHGFNWPKARE
jgi:hypothetical protein